VTEYPLLVECDAALAVDLSGDDLDNVTPTIMAEA
jgi:hypothetical protein